VFATHAAEAVELWFIGGTEGEMRAMRGVDHAARTHLNVERPYASLSRWQRPRAD
jgi:hypothetical protein